MSQNVPTPHVFSIAVGIDYSEASAMALQQAVRVAETHERSHIHIVHSIPGVPPLGHGLSSPDLMMAAITPGTVSRETLAAEMSRNLQSYVEKALTELGDGDSARRSGLEWTVHLRNTDATLAIVQLAVDVEADLVVVGTHGRGWLAHFLLGSVAEGVVRRAPCPVLVVRPAGVTAAAAVPEIEPPCPDCLSTRKATEGAEFWCDRHREHHARAHTYHFTPFRDSHQSGVLLHPLE
jgi:nucleotide-binding universal stress UspA family protein